MQFWSVNYALAARMCKKIRAKQAVLVVVFKAKAVYNSFKNQQDNLSSVSLCDCISEQ